MDWHKRSTVEGMKKLLEGLYVPDPSSSLLISRNRVLDPENEIYSDFFFKLFPRTSGGVFTIIDGEKRLVVALREAISEMSLPGYVRVEAIDDNSWDLGRLHGMRRVKYKRSVSEYCMIALQKTVNQTILAAIWGYMNVHFLVAAGVGVFASMFQSDVLTAIVPAVLSLTILENMNWRSFQKRNLAKMVHKKETWRESEEEYQRRLVDICTDPSKWYRAKVHLMSMFSQRFLGNLVNRYYEWNASRRPSLRLERMSVVNVSS